MVDSVHHPVPKWGAANSCGPCRLVLRPKADASAARGAVHSDAGFPAPFPAPARDCRSAKVHDCPWVAAVAPAQPGARLLLQEQPQRDESLQVAHRAGHQAAADNFQVGPDAAELADSVAHPSAQAAQRQAADCPPAAAHQEFPEPQVAQPAQPAALDLHQGRQAHPALPGAQKTQVAEQPKQPLAPPQPEPAPKAPQHLPSAQPTAPPDESPDQLQPEAQH